MKIRHNRFARLVSMLLAVVLLIGAVPTNIFAIETFAVKEENKNNTPGDANGDGLINALDVNFKRGGGHTAVFVALFGGAAGKAREVCVARGVNEIFALYCI